MRTYGTCDSSYNWAIRANLLQGSSPFLTTLRNSRSPGDGRRKGRRHIDIMTVLSRSRTNCRKSRMMSTGRASWQRQERQEKAANGHGAWWNTQMTKALLQKELHLLIPFQPANLSSWSQIRHHTTSHCATSVCCFPRSNLFANFYFCQSNLFPEA